MKPSVVSLNDVKEALKSIDPHSLISAMEQGFVAYSEGRVIVPPVGHLQFDEPPGDTHIKYGYIPGDGTYVIKVATSFYENPKKGLPSANGLMLVFSQKTGELLSVLLDEGYLTNTRTALAGAVVAKYLAPRGIKGIGIVGTGIQARMQLQYLHSIVDCSNVYVWGRSDDALQKYVVDMRELGFSKVTPTKDMRELTHNCNYIVTTTPSNKPLVMAKDILGGTHITAVGADTLGKQELDPSILGKADIVVVDSKSQCIDHGDTSYAVQQKLVNPDGLIELGSLIKNDSRRKYDTEITVADLTGVAVQDIQIATQVYDVLRAKA